MRIERRSVAGPCDLRPCLDGLDEDGMRRVRYEDAEHVQITRDFLDEPGRFLEHLLEE